jgi:hypothetical protein
VPRAWHELHLMGPAYDRNGNTSLSWK